MEIVNITYAGPGYEYQDYSVKDDKLIVSNFINSTFGDSEDYIEYYIYDQNGTQIDINYNASDYYPRIVNPVTDKYSFIELNPKKDLESRGYSRGVLNIQYNFLKNLFNSSISKQYWIKEISNSRTELKLSSQMLSDDLILDGFNRYSVYTSNKNYYSDFYLNFGNNKLLICTNVAYIEEGGASYLLIKLYEPLPNEFSLKDQLWIVDKIAESTSYNVDIQVEATTVVSQNLLRGPNLKIPINKKNGLTTPYYNYTSLFSSSISSSNKLLSYYDDKALDINVDFSDFSNFIHFSSAETRLLNFKYKVSQIESYSAELSALNAITSTTDPASITSSISLVNGYIEDIVTRFDIYEYYLYFQSESFAWPKSNQTQP